MAFYLAVLARTPGTLASFQTQCAYCADRRQAFFEQSLAEIWTTRGFQNITASRSSRLEVTLSDAAGEALNFCVRVLGCAAGWPRRLRPALFCGIRRRLTLLCSAGSIPPPHPD